MSLVFWLTTSTDCSYSDGPAAGAYCAGGAGGGGGGGGVGAACWKWSVHPWPSHQRVPALPAGSGYQPGGGGGCVTAVKLAAPEDVRGACQTPAMADLTAAEVRVLDAVDEEWVVDRLCRLIAIPSVDGTDAEIEVQHVLADWLRELDCDVD